MAALTRSAVLLAFALLAIGDVRAQCTFIGGEIQNPDAPGCGDRQLTFAANNPTGDPDVVALGYPVPIPVASVTPVDGFRDYPSLHAGHQDMMLNHAEVAGVVVGNTRSGDDIWAYRIGTPGDETIQGEAKGSVLINGGIHAREWQTPETLTEVFERLVAGRTDGGMVQYLVENLAVVLIPVLNVDGFRQTQAFPNRSTAHPAQPRDGRFRRKNLNHAPGGLVDADLTSVADNTHGVDLNRNHPVGFRTQAGNSLTRSLIYAGTSAHSEPETQALLAAAALADTNRLRLYIDVHSFTQIYFTPQTNNATRNQNTELLADAMRAVTNNKYRYSPDPVGTDIGTTASYFAATHQVPSWTLETEPLNGSQDYGGIAYGHGGFVAPDSAIARIRDELADTLLLGFYRQAGPPAIIAAEIRDGAGAIVWSMDWTANGNGTRSRSIGTNGTLQAGTGYTLWVAFDKPMRWRTGGQVTQYPGQAIALAPTVTLEYTRGGGTVRRAVSTTANAWIGAVGATPGGSLNYTDDAFSVPFTVPAGIPRNTTQLTLAVATTDLSGFHLDTDPASVAGWSNGAWTGYQSEDGPVQTQSSGPDRTITVGVTGGTGGSGGGQIGWLTLALFTALVALRRSARVRRRVH